jgi:hypothetical protein
MAVEKTLANPTIEINDAVIGIVPNSASYKTGKGDINIRAQSAGGNSIDVIKTENAETKISMVKFKLYNTSTNVGLVRTWQDSVDGNTIAMSDGDFIESFREMFVITDPEVMLGADGELEVEFNGRPSL